MWRWNDRRFWVRLVFAYILVPPIAPFLLIASMRYNDLDHRLQIAYLYWLFCLAAMTILGAPLSYVYSRRGWSSFAAFMLGGAVCASTTVIVMYRGRIDVDQLKLFTTFGVVEGLIFRLVLFGFSADPSTSARQSGQPDRR